MESDFMETSCEQTGRQTSGCLGKLSIRRSRKEIVPKRKGQAFCACPSKSLGYVGKIYLFGSLAGSFRFLT